jgi:peroxin-1
MDGAEGLEGVYIVGTTSRPDLIDGALLRPGRLDKSLEFGMPDAGEREEILRGIVDGMDVRIDGCILRTSMLYTS